MEYLAVLAIVAQLVVARCWQTFFIAAFLAGVLYVNQFAPGPLTSNPFFWVGVFLWFAVWLVWFEQLPKRAALKAETQNKAQQAAQPAKQRATLGNAKANQLHQAKASAAGAIASQLHQAQAKAASWRANAPAFELNSAQELESLLELTGSYLASPKLDGIFARWIPNQGLFTKNGRRITCLAHIEQQLSQGATANHIIDGEIYSSALKFELINGLVRCELARPEHSKLSFNAFDLPEHNGDHATRQQLLSKIITASDAVNLISTQLINAGQAGERYQHFLNQGYEGLILRCMQSLNVYKHKPLQDTEARLVGFTPAKNDKQPFNGLVLQMPSGKTFVISNLKKAQRELLWQQGANGQLITYSYQQLTAKGLPRFARYKALRHDMAVN